MLEGNIMMTTKMYVTCLLVAFMATIGIFLFQLQQGNNFKQYVNYQIEQNGGLTTSAVSKINDYSEKHFNGRFSVQSSQMNQKFKYGTEIDYEITGRFTFLFLDFEDVNLPIKGSALSFVR